MADVDDLFDCFNENNDDSIAANPVVELEKIKSADSLEERYTYM